MAEIDPNKFLATSVAEFASQVATGIAHAQSALDEAAFALWKKVESDPELKELKEIGYQPTWYSIPIAEAEIRLTFYYESEGSAAASRRMYVLPFNAKTQNSSKLREEGTSQLKMKVVPTPPPISLTVSRKE